MIIGVAISEKGERHDPGAGTAVELDGLEEPAGGVDQECWGAVRRRGTAVWTICALIAVHLAGLTDTRIGINLEFSMISLPLRLFQRFRFQRGHALPYSLVHTFDEGVPHVWCNLWDAFLGSHHSVGRLRVQVAISASETLRDLE